MDLLMRSIVAVIIIIVAIGALFFLVSSGVFAQQVTQGQAQTLVLSDIQNSNPGAIVNITNVTTSQYAGSWHILASVILNATSPCPSYFIYSFDYPKYGFVSRIENTYTDNCAIYGQGNSSIIGSSSAAITRSYDINASRIMQFIRQYGYTSVITHAMYQSSVNYLGRDYTNVWIVNYTAPNTNSSVTALITQANGSVIGVYGQTQPV